jgi:hypothetical protein
MKALLILLFPFLAVNAYAQDCSSYFEKKVDKFKGGTDFLLSGLNHVSLMKSISAKGVTSYFLSLTTTGHTAAVAGKGAIVLLGDGTKISRSALPIDIEVEMDHYYGSGDYEYSGFFPISKAELSKIAQSGITDFQLFIFDQEIPIEKRESIKLAASCMPSLK